MALGGKTSASTAGNSPVIQITGTIQEVLDELQNQNVTAKKVIFFLVSGANARAAFCRFK